MTAVSLTDVLKPAMAGGYAVAGLVVSGWEEACAYTEAGEEAGIPIILQAGPACRKHTPVPVLGKMFRYLADQAKTPVVCHIDHGYSLEECLEGIEHGFTSVMFDGSRLPIAQNIETTAKIAEVAHRANVCVEGEVGFVGYANGKQSLMTLPEEAALFDRESGADALAISVGNTHLQTQKAARIDLGALQAIEAVTRLPLVLHGGSGIAAGMRQRIARETRVSKFNIGTELRMAFAHALRRKMQEDDSVFDRIELLSSTIKPVKKATIEVITALWEPAA